MKLTIGMACYEDFNGVYFTIQNIRAHYDCRDVEFVVIDNQPDSISGKMTANFMKNVPNGKYVPFPEPKGTTQPRNKVFEVATGDFVMCVDSHITLIDTIQTTGEKIDILPRLFNFLAHNKESNDLYSGPILMDNLSTYGTHFDDYIRAQMWGIWASAWRCTCPDMHGMRKTDKGVRFSVNPPVDMKGPRADEMATFRLLGMGNVPITMCQACNKKLPTNIPHIGHEKKLIEQGYYPIGSNPLDPPFEIPGMGLGLFLCRKEAWLGFSPHFRGFGGEELYIHEKFRQAGHKAICLPFLRWGHRFGRENGGVRYPLTLWNKVRNLVICHQELGLDLEHIHRHFVEEGKWFKQDRWDYLLGDPIGRVSEEKGCEECGASATDKPANHILEVGDNETIFQWLKSIPRDLDQHLDTLRAYASKGKTATEFTHRRESTAALLASGCRVTSYNLEEDDVVAKLKQLNPESTILAIKSEDVAVIQETDFLFLDSEHTEKCLTRELMTHGPKVNKYIALHDTVLHATNGEDGGPGLSESLRKFLSTYPEWFAVYHNPRQYGLTVLGRDQSEEPAVTPFWGSSKGPGAELKKLLASIGIEPNKGCDCNAKAGIMDVWGVEGCELRFDSIVHWMTEGHEKWGWKDKLSAGFKSIITGMVWTMNPIAPMQSLIRKAIENAKKEGAK